MNPRRTFQHVRDFQSRSLDRSDTPPSGAILAAATFGDRGSQVCRAVGLEHRAVRDDQALDRKLRDPFERRQKPHGIGLVDENVGSSRRCR